MDGAPWVRLLLAALGLACFVASCGGSSQSDDPSLSLPVDLTFEVEERSSGVICYEVRADSANISVEEDCVDGVPPDDVVLLYSEACCGGVLQLYAVDASVDVASVSQVGMRQPAFVESDGALVVVAEGFGDRGTIEVEITDGSTSRACSFRDFFSQCVLG